MSTLKAVRISVTQLATFACRRGDLQPEAMIGPTALEGMRVHTAVQNKRKQIAGRPDYLVSESRVNCQYCVDNYEFSLGGRIDLLDTQALVLSEIKSTCVPAEQVPESQHWLHWAQLYLYGFVYLEQLTMEQLKMQVEGQSLPEPVTELSLEIIYFNLRAGTEHSELRQVPVSELSNYGVTALHKYAQWLSLVDKSHERMLATASDLQFPFDAFRPGQHEMAAQVYRASRDAKRLMCEAPTGIGKTISSLYPAIRSMGEGSVSQLVYLTAKVAGRHSAEQAVERLSAGGLHITMLQIRAKQSTCFCTNGRCERDATGRCPMTLGFFDRLPAAREELLDLGVIDNEKLDDIAWQHQLCPFELVQQLLPWVQLVVADYNYVFDPLVRLALFSPTNKSTSNKSSSSKPSTSKPSTRRKRILLIDEAHNLVDRARSMYSARLDRVQCMLAATECRQPHALVARELDKLSARLLKMMADGTSGYHVSREASDALSRCVAAVLTEMTATMASPMALSDTLRELWLALCRYAVIHDLFSDNHRLVIESNRQGMKRQVVVSLRCVDPSRALSNSYDMFRSTVFFSATLHPASFYRDTLGLAQDTGYLTLPSPFPAENCLRCVVDWIDTRYRQRQQSMLQLVSLIHETTSDKPGNYLVFFPSYAYLEQVHTQFSAAYPERSTWVQSRGQTKNDQQYLLSQLDKVGHRVGFAIQGGVFGEGIDYKGERLIGTLVIGTGLPAVDWQSELMAEHYREQGHDGYEFAYRNPGFTRVLQTAGRVIRSESDRGFVMLVDARFRQAAYRALYPPDWQVQYPQGMSALMDLLHRFWDCPVEV